MLDKTASDIRALSLDSAIDAASFYLPCDAFNFLYDQRDESLINEKSEEPPHRLGCTVCQLIESDSSPSRERED